MIRTTLHQSRYDLRAFLRNRQSQFFTLALPILFLVIFASLFGGRGNTTQVAGGRISTSVYYVPGVIALGVIAACFGNLAASVTWVVFWPPPNTDAKITRKSTGMASAKNCDWRLRRVARRS